MDHKAWEQGWREEERDIIKDFAEADAEVTALATAIVRMTGVRFEDAERLAVDLLIDHAVMAYETGGN